MKDWDDKMKRRKVIWAVQVQLGYHDKYVGDLGNRLDSLDVRCDSSDEALDILGFTSGKGWKKR